MAILAIYMEANYPCAGGCGKQERGFHPPKNWIQFISVPVTRGKHTTWECACSWECVRAFADNQIRDKSKTMNHG